MNSSPDDALSRLEKLVLGLQTSFDSSVKKFDKSIEKLDDIAIQTTNNTKRLDNFESKF